MPHQPDITKREVKRIWQWLDQIRKNKMTQYLPFYHEELTKALQAIDQQKDKATGSSGVKQK